jgi:nicotinate phosphoribosyltransferase
VNPLSSPLVTDYYQLVMLESYLRQGMTEIAVFELFVRKLPQKEFSGCGGTGAGT